eukprot:1916276-Rhodomonas_salina.2
MSGTERCCLPMRALRDVRTDLAYPDAKSTTCASATTRRTSPGRCFLSSSAPSRRDASTTDIAYVPTHPLVRNYQELISRIKESTFTWINSNMVTSATSLCNCYAMSGTDVAYGAVC